jgi:hypothetical protein
MKNIWSILCQKVMIDEKTNNLNLLNCLEEIRLNLDKTKTEEIKKNVVTFIKIDFQLVTYWLLDGTKKAVSSKLKIEVIDPNNKPLNMSENNIEIPAGNLKFRNILSFNSLPFSVSGRYTLKVSQLKGKDTYETVSELPIDITY